MLIEMLSFILLMPLMTASVRLKLGPYPGDNVKTEDRIVGGRPISIINRPYQAYLEIFWNITYAYRPDSFCGGIIYNEQYIITAARCVFNPFTLDFATTILVTVGKTNLLLQDEQQDQYVVMELIQNAYNHLTGNDDIVLLKLQTCMVFSGYAQAVPLSSLHPTLLNDSVPGTISGWGVTDTLWRNSVRGKYGHTLQLADVEVISNLQCREVYQGFDPTALYQPGTPPSAILPLPVVPLSSICASSHLPGGDVCVGDAGGPLICEYPGYPATLCGIISNGAGCGLGLPAIYTDIALYIDWIYAHTSGANSPNCGG